MQTGDFGAGTGLSASRKRGNPGKASFGLGLSIVAEIVTAHGGTLTFTDNAPVGLIARLDPPNS